MMKWVRTFLALLAGMFLITLVAESIEFGLVTAVQGSVTTDRAVYFGIRNQPAFLAVKLLYNSLAAGLGGYVCAWIAGWREVLHGATLALVQAGTLLWAMTQPELAQWTPFWVWIALITVMSPATVLGAWLVARGKAARQARSTP